MGWLLYYNIQHVLVSYNIHLDSALLLRPARSWSSLLKAFSEHISVELLNWELWGLVCLCEECGERQAGDLTWPPSVDINRPDSQDKMLSLLPITLLLAFTTLPGGFFSLISVNCLEGNVWFSGLIAADNSPYSQYSSEQNSVYDTNYDYAGYSGMPLREFLPEVTLPPEWQ